MQEEKPDDVVETQPEELVDLKVCKKCNAEKSLTEFYKHSKSKDGYRDNCKECVKMAKKPNLIGRMCKKLGLTEEQMIIVLIILETILIVVLELK